MEGSHSPFYGMCHGWRGGALHTHTLLCSSKKKPESKVVRSIHFLPLPACLQPLTLHCNITLVIFCCFQGFCYCLSPSCDLAARKGVYSLSCYCVRLTKARVIQYLQSSISLTGALEQFACLYFYRLSTTWVLKREVSRHLRKKLVSRFF